MNRSFLCSVLLHVAVIGLLFINLPAFMRNRAEMVAVPVYIDLKDVQITAKTNLPPAKTEKKKTPPKEEKPAPQEKPKPIAPKPVQTQPEKKEVVPISDPAPKDAAKAVDTKPVVKPVEADKKPKTPPVSKPKPVQQEKKVKDTDWDSLLASVDAVKKKPAPMPLAQDEKETAGDEMNPAQKTTGASGLMNQPLTVSERDLIASKLRDCWNVDAGREGIETMIVQLRAFIGRDGRVRGVKILNMNDNPAFRSVAESARRAIYICDNKGDESPFKILSEQHPETYDIWKELFLRFNPVDGGIF